MIGFVEVTDDIEDDDNLRTWVDFAWDFVATLPPKADKPVVKAVGAKQAARKRRTTTPP